MIPAPSCPLCLAERSLPYHQDTRRSYLQCPCCQLIFIPAEFHLSLEDEKTQYDYHQNDPGDPGYRRFLSRLSQPLLACLSPNSHGLDFGCGPGPALSQVLAEAGHDVSLYDPFYAPDQRALEQLYDFITATEVVEHLRQPRRELDRLWGLLRPGGWLGIMTKQVKDREAFATWHYIRDETHICFFSRDTFTWLANHLHADITFHGSDVVLLRKPPETPLSAR